jgi:CRISPR-associated endonuclease/helicase Cas3
MTAQEPLAKRYPPQSLSQHTSQVLEAAEAMANALHLPEDIAQMLRDAAVLHDVGKAAKGFQRMLQEDERWQHRHELLSAAIALALEMPPEVVLAVATHHKSLNDVGLDESGIRVTEVVWQKHGVQQWNRLLSELGEHWQWVTEFLAAKGSDRLPPSPDKLPPVRELLRQYSAPNHRMSPEQQRRLVLLRGLLMAADHLASGHQTVPARLPEPVWKHRAWYPFQQQMANVQGHVVLEAPTGSGKTEAAILWALHNRKAGERIFYVLPTQASINAMVHRLRGVFCEEAVAPVHARVLQQEFQAYFSDDNYHEAVAKARDRVDLYRQFYAPLKVLTPHQIVKHLFGVSKFEVGLAEMYNGLVIVDEVHAYDARIQALLECSLRFLVENYGVRVCLMSATMPDFLKQRMLQLVPDATQISAYADTRFTKPRHRLVVWDRLLEECVGSIRADLEAGKRVLVICNRVQQAQWLYTLLRDAASVALIHSRFTYGDRSRIERRVLEASSQAQLLIATQVVEVSLDIDYDVCYTEVAPVDDLLQRFGRVNRRGRLPEPAEVIVCARFDEEKVRYVYDGEYLRRTLGAAPDGKALTHDILLQWLQDVYKDGWSRQSEQAYRDTITTMRVVLDALVPLREAEHTIDFDRLFGAIDVVPSALQEEYLHRISERQWLLAHDFLVPIRYSTYYGLKSRDLIIGAADGTPVVRVKYSSETGLGSHLEEDVAWLA